MLKVSQLTLRRQGQALLEQVTLTLQPGARQMLMGPSGAGKSTLLKCVAGLLRADEGAILWDGAPLQARHVTLMEQRPALFPHLDVAQNVAFGLRVRGEAREARMARVASALSWVELEGFEARAVSGLSGGQAQRVALARALVCQPKVLLLDEPFSALDHALREQLAALLIRLQAAQGFGLIWVTHELGHALRFGHEVGLMQQGRLELVGAPGALRSRLREDEALSARLGLGAHLELARWLEAQ